LVEITGDSDLLYLNFRYLPSDETIDDIVQCFSKETDDLIFWDRFHKKSNITNWTSLNRFLTRIVREIYKIFIPQLNLVLDPFPPAFIIRKTRVDVPLPKFRKTPFIYALLSSKQMSISPRYGHFEVKKKGGLSEVLAALLHLYSLAKFTGEIKRMLKFAFVGVTGIFVNEGLLYTLTEYLGLYYLHSGAISIEASILSNFTLNELWTFRDRREGGKKDIAKRALKYNVVSIGGLLINLLVLYLLVEFLGMYYLVANLLGIFLGFVWNFSLNTLWTWKVKKLHRKQ